MSEEPEKGSSGWVTLLLVSLIFAVACSASYGFGRRDGWRAGNEATVKAILEVLDAAHGRHGDIV